MLINTNILSHENNNMASLRIHSTHMNCVLISATKKRTTQKQIHISFNYRYTQLFVLLYVYDSVQHIECVVKWMNEWMLNILWHTCMFVYMFVKCKELKNFNAFHSGPCMSWVPTIIVNFIYIFRGLLLVPTIAVSLCALSLCFNLNFFSFHFSALHNFLQILCFESFLQAGLIYERFY